jgi:hypothetical protein
MKNPKSVVNIAVAGLLAVGVIGIGAVSYSQIQADTVLPGYATAHLQLKITAPAAESIDVKAVFAPSSGNKYYSQEKSFALSEGTNNIDWLIRKIPAGQYNLQMTAGQGDFIPSSRAVTLTSDKENAIDVVSLNLAQQVEPTHTLPLLSSETPTLQDQPAGDQSAGN